MKGGKGMADGQTRRKMDIWQLVRSQGMLSSCGYVKLGFSIKWDTYEKIGT